MKLLMKRSGGLLLKSLGEVLTLSIISAVVLVQCLVVESIIETNLYDLAVGIGNISIQDLISVLKSLLLKEL